MFTRLNQTKIEANRKVTSFNWGSYELVALPIFTDNYVWLIGNGSTFCVVDPGDFSPIQHYVSSKQKEISSVLITHSHWDHVSGLEALLKHYPACTVLRSKESKKNSYSLMGIEIEVLDFSGHTSDHIGFVLRQQDEKHLSPILMCGDALFSLGCGRVEGSAYEQSFKTLERILRLPEDTWVCCTHEYTQKNLRFALKMEPDSSGLLRLSHALEGMEMTLPSTLSFERIFNPFLRVVLNHGADDSLRQGLVDRFGEHFFSLSPLDLFIWLRQQRDQF
jgi:hydroxyacylglutathione hydrolase